LRAAVLHAGPDFFVFECVAHGNKTLEMDRQAPSKSSSPLSLPIQIECKNRIALWRPGFFQLVPQAARPSMIMDPKGSRKNVKLFLREPGFPPPGYPRFGFFCRNMVCW
jgi:hypothetical protein